MQADLLEVLQQDAALRLDDGLGQAGRAGGVQDPQRVVEGDLLEDGLDVRRRDRRPVESALGGLGAEQRDVDHRAQGGELAAQLGDGVGTVVLLAAVAVAVHREQDDRLDLLEAVEDAAGAEVGGAGCPDSADRRGGEQRGDGLRDVGQIAADPVPRAYTEGAQFGGERAHLAAELGPADRGRLMCLVHMKQRRIMGALLGGAQGMFGVVEHGAGEPPGAGHGPVGQDALVRSGETDVEPFGDRLPEGFELVDRPAVQRRVTALGRGPVALGGPGLEAGDPGGGDAVGVRLPQGAGFAAEVMGRLRGGSTRCVRFSRARAGCARDTADTDDAM